MAFVLPTPRIRMDSDLRSFQTSPAYELYVQFLTDLSTSVTGKSNSTDCTVSSLVQGLVDMLKTLGNWIDDIPPIKQPSRFGNAAFKVWYEKLTQEIIPLLQKALPDEFHPAIIELAPYLLSAFGNQVRVDYGTGHEASFAVFLCCVSRLNLIQAEDHCAVVTRVFVEYLNVTRKLQTVYMLEPAGSHGVWGLDDFQFLPFYFGAAQLIGHPTIQPSSIHDDRVLEKYGDDYLYLKAIQYIRKFKRGLLAETSPMLNDMSAVPGGWPKLNAGLMKMYKVEVLGKVPVIQHFVFGTLFPFQKPQTTEPQSQ